MSEVPFADISGAARPSFVPDFDISGKTREISNCGSSAEGVAASNEDVADGSQLGRDEEGVIGDRLQDRTDVRSYYSAEAGRGR